jgi:hypothetical protein
MLSIWNYADAASSLNAGFRNLYSLSGPVGSDRLCLRPPGPANVVLLGGSGVEFRYRLQNWSFKEKSVEYSYLRPSFDE